MTTPAIKPSVVRPVHYFAEGQSPEAQFSGPFAAIVTAVNEDAASEGNVDLVVFFPGQPGKPKGRVPYSDKPSKGCWTWPPRA